MRQPRAHLTRAGETYYQNWLAALEQMATAKSLVGAAALHRTRNAWSQAAERTQHGTPTESGAEDFFVSLFSD
jgi:hypothetical protein